MIYVNKLYSVQQPQVGFEQASYTLILAILLQSRIISDNKPERLLVLPA